jgi:aspartate/methionine/tyrosine aminotransferase
MVAGDAGLIAKFRALRNIAGPQVALPILAASAAAWSEETHVAANRQTYQARMRAAEGVLGQHPGFRIPGGGFFLWLEVRNGEETALRLWREQGVRVLPGGYMGREILPGKTQSNPGFSYIRVALVSDLSTIMTALERVKNLLG